MVSGKVLVKDKIHRHFLVAKRNNITQGIMLALLGWANFALAEPAQITTQVVDTHTDIKQSNQYSELSNDVADVIQLDAVVVTTRRREEKAQDVPTPMTVLSGKTLETHRLHRIEELQQALPSVNVAYGNPRQSSVAVRGLGNNPANDGLEASVGVYLDNVYLGRPGMAVFDILDIAQLELLRGPQGTLFGKNTTAGLLNITSKAPTFYPDHHLEFSTGSRNYFQAKGSLSDALSETVAGRFSFYKTSQDGFIENIAIENANKLNSTDRQGIRGQILWQPTDTFNLRWIADYHEEDDTQGASVLYDQGPTFNHPTLGENYNRYIDNGTQAGADLYLGSFKNKQIATSDTAQRMQVQQGGTSVEANWALDNGQKLTSITAYRFWDFTPRNSAGITADAIRNIGVPVEDDQFSQELRLASAKNDTFDWVTGLYYFQQNIKNNGETRYGTQADPYMLYQNPALRQDIQNGNTNILNSRTSHTYANADTKSYAIFGQGVWHLTPRFDLTTGARVTYEDKKAHVSRTLPTGGVDINSLPIQQRNLVNGMLGAYDSGELNLNNTNYAGLLTGSYKITPEQLFYATYSHGEKSGGFNLSVGSAPTAGADSLKIDPEKADNFELGLKQTLLKNQLQLNTSIFWVNVSDYQTTGGQQIGANFVSVLDNAGKVRSRGAEIDLTYQPSRQLTLNFNGSWNDTIYTEYKNAPASAVLSIQNNQAFQDLSGQRVYAVPEWIANFNFRYDLIEKNSWKPYVAGSYAWRDWAYGNLDNAKTSIIPAYGIVNASAGSIYTIGENQLDLSLWVKNLTNKTYATTVLNGFNGISNAILGQPRTIGATLKLSF